MAKLTMEIAELIRRRYRAVLVTGKTDAEFLEELKSQVTMEGATA
jgi:hypothetical protein